MGFAVMLAAAGLLTLRSGIFARWIGVVAALGALSFLITFLALIQGTSEDSVFGYGFLPGVLALAIWSIATSLAAYRAVTTTGHKIVGQCRPEELAASRVTRSPPNRVQARRR